MNRACPRRTSQLDPVAVPAQLDGVNLAAIDWYVGGSPRSARTVAYSPEIELTTLASRASAPASTEFYRGVDGLVRYLHEWLEPFSEYLVENHDFIDAGNCVVVPARQMGVGEGSGVEVELELTTLSRCATACIVRWHQYETRRGGARGREADGG